jgi:hypothetical protein
VVSFIIVEIDLDAVSGEVRFAQVTQEGVGSSIFTEKQIDFLAKRAHEIFCEDLLRQGYRYGPILSEEEKMHPSLVPYEQLSEDLKQSNRDFIRNIPSTVASAGYTLSPKEDADPETDFPGSYLETLAEMEHERWVRDTDPELKIHAAIVEWEELSASEREKDRLKVHAIPRILSLAGFTIGRLADRD